MGWKETYENEVHSGGQRFSFEWYFNHAITTELIDKKVIRGRVCDVACGLGVRSLIFSSASNSTVVGIDFDEWAVNYAKKKAIDLGVFGMAAKFEVGNFYNLPFEDGMFDTVVFIAGIEHAAFPVKVLGELFRIASQNGRIVITTTQNDVCTDLDRKSSFSEAGLRRLLSSFGKTCTWTRDGVIYAISDKSGGLTTKNQKKRLVYVDMRHPDTYTEEWDNVFQTCFDLVPIDFEYSGIFGKGQKEKLLHEIQFADVLHFGTGAISLSRSLLETIRQIRPDLIISKWWGDVSPQRYRSECEDNSDIFDTIFLSVSNYVGMCTANCTQIHLNSPGVRPSLGTLFPFHSRRWDAAVFANAYSEERLKRIVDCTRTNKWQTVWYGDGSPNGRLHRTKANQLLGSCRINLNIVEQGHQGYRHWFSARVSNAMAAGNIVITSRIEGLKSVLGDLVVVGGDDAGSWCDLIDLISSQRESYEEMSSKCIEYHNEFLSYERAMETMLCAWGL